MVVVIDFFKCLIALLLFSFPYKVFLMVAVLNKYWSEFHSNHSWRPLMEVTTHELPKAK